MTISEAIYQFLQSALTGTTAAGKAYSVAGVPKAALPRVTYQRVGGVREAKVGGGTANHARGRYQVTVYSATQLEAETLILAILAQARTMPQSAPIRAVDIETGPYDMPVQVAGAETQTAAVAVDLGVTYQEH